MEWGWDCCTQCYGPPQSVKVSSAPPPPNHIRDPYMGPLFGASPLKYLFHSLTLLLFSATPFLGLLLTSQILGSHSFWIEWLNPLPNSIASLRTVSLAPGQEASSGIVTHILVLSTVDAASPHPPNSAKAVPFKEKEIEPFCHSLSLSSHAQSPSFYALSLSLCHLLP